MRGFGLILTAGLALAASTARAGPAEEVQARFADFVAAQNAHDLPAVRRMLAQGPEFVWITRGQVVEGPDAAIERFRSLYAGTWRLTPGPHVRTFVIAPDTVQLVAPVSFTIGPPGQAAADTDFLLTQLWRRSADGWRIESLLPIAVPAR